MIDTDDIREWFMIALRALWGQTLTIIITAVLTWNLYGMKERHVFDRLVQLSPVCALTAVKAGY